jgi:hypothetical protein
MGWGGLRPVDGRSPSNFPPNFPAVILGKMGGDVKPTLV